MLCLSRKANEVIIIGRPPNEVTVTVIEVRGDKVRLGINAPDNVEIDRAEVRLSKDQDGRKNH